MGNSRWRGSAKDGEKKKARLSKWYICLSVYLSGYRSENLSQCMTFGEKKDTQLLGYPLFEIAASQLPFAYIPSVSPRVHFIALPQSSAR